MTNQSLSRLLIADDNEQYLKSLERLLKSRFQLDLVTNADEEIAKARVAYESGNRYLAIITDNQMNDGKTYGMETTSYDPETVKRKNICFSGLYAIREIRVIDKMTPLFFHSCDHASEILIEAIIIGADAILRKPLQLRELNELIEKYSGERK